MTLRRAAAFAFTIVIVGLGGAIVGLGGQAEAKAPCQELMRLRNAASEAWKHAMTVPPSQRCGALYHASLATKATLNYANSNHESCNVSVPLLNQVEGYHREAVQARANACGGRPLRPYPAELIQR